MNTIEFSPAELLALKKEHAPAATDEQFELWVADCKRRGLMPVRDVLLQTRSVEEYDQSVRAKVRRNKAYYITTIGAFRKIAEGTGKYAGQLPAKWLYLDDKNQPTIEAEVPLPEPEHPEKPRIPWAVKVALLRKDFDAPISVTARFWAYAQTTKYNDKEVLTSMWRTRGPEQLEKCCEALALRKGFPELLGGLYIAEELKAEDEPEQTPTPVTPVAAAPTAPTVPTVNHTPATPTNEARPNEPRTHSNAGVPAEPATVTPALNPKKEEPQTITEVVLKNVPEEEPTEEPKVVAAPVQKTDKPAAERARYLIERGVEKENLKKYALKHSGAEATNKITKEQWEALLTPLEQALASGGKDATNTIITDKLKGEN